MGCDIHFHTEVKINGKWEHYGQPYVQRNYRLFALLADVRNGDGEIKAISKPKGMPDDASLVTKLACESYGVDSHSHSWLGAAEIAKFEDAWVKLHDTSLIAARADIEHHLIGYVDHTSWSSFVRYPNEKPKWIEDVRWVFWFDN